MSSTNIQTAGLRLSLITEEGIKEVKKALREKGIQRKEIANITRVLRELILTEGERKKWKNRRMNFITNSVELEEKILQALRQNPQGLICEEIGREVHGYPISDKKNPVEYQVFYKILHDLMKEGKVTTERVRDKLTSFGARRQKCIS